MAASLPERLFSLEVLVDWVRLEAGELPSSSGAVQEASLPPPSDSLCPAVAFRLLDFPTLLVYPPGGPASEHRPGVVRFGRGKACLFRLHPATLHRLLLETPLYALLLQLRSGFPTPAPQLLGSCSISLADAAQKVLGPAASTCSQSHRGSYPVRDLMGKQIGDLSLGYRLAHLENHVLGHLERPIIAEDGLAEQKAGEVSSQVLLENPRPRQLTPDPSSGADGGNLVDLKTTNAQKDLKEGVNHSDARADNRDFVEKGKMKSSVCSNASSRRCDSPLNQEELDIETNTFCPPPLYYTHFVQEKTPPALGKITFVPQVNGPEERNGIFQEEKCAHLPTCTYAQKNVNITTNENPPSILRDPPTNIQDLGASSQMTCHPQTEQTRVNIIKQLPLLNALLVELSLLYAQPSASPTHIHPHLAWLYRSEDKTAPASSAKSTCKCDSNKEKLSIEEKKQSVSLQYRKNQVENTKKGMCFEKTGGNPRKRVPKGKLLYGITNTLKLRLKQTNPDMLVVHEKREQYRKMQAQMLGAKLSIPSPKVKVLSFTERVQKPHQLPEGQCLDLDSSFAESGNTSKQISGVFDDTSTANATGKQTVEYSKYRTSSGTLGEITAAKPIISEKFPHAIMLEGNVEMKVRSPCIFQQDAIIDRKLVDKKKANRQVKTTENGIADRSENKLINKNSCSENVSELTYSDDFTSPCYSEDFYTTEDTSRSLPGCDGSQENAKHHTSKSSEATSSMRKNSSEKSSILSPPFSAGLPVHSSKRSHASKTQKSLEEASSISTSDSSSLHWPEEKEKKIDLYGMHNSKVVKRNQDISIKLKTKTGCKSLEKSQSPRTSQVSSYLPSNLSELELSAVDSSTSDQFEENSDEVGSLHISKQCKDICELVINKLPGYTV
ncbi:PREDICTED: microtubule-associated protein 10-like [Chrysochloris asiatica]|uniref:Microtubule-associated protein 10-like n=1 Tax=Chrysochloris asiatica TaxID=185453 RepID=A0A9B0X013_CHRAS|nr:PREDICTED: microtubule-associated protein 10-like [Chrysochloris asiatica]